MYRISNVYTTYINITISKYSNWSQNLKYSHWSQNLQNSDWSQHLKYSDWFKNLKYSEWSRNLKYPDWSQNQKYSAFSQNLKHSDWFQNFCTNEALFMRKVSTFPLLSNEYLTSVSIKGTFSDGVDLAHNATEHII